MELPAPCMVLSKNSKPHRIQLLEAMTPPMHSSPDLPIVLYRACSFHAYIYSFLLRDGENFILKALSIAQC